MKTKGSTNTISDSLSKLIKDTNINEMSESEIDLAKFLTLDFIGLAARGNHFETSKPVHKYLENFGGKGSGTIIGKRGIKSLPQYSALANGAAAHSLELDDVINEASLHPAVAVFPTALATSEYYGSTGKSFIEASLVGYEVMGRLGKALNPSNVYTRGFHPTGICGVFGTVATASKIMNLSEKQTTYAFGIAGSQAAASMEFLESGAWTKRLHPGWASHSGMIASELASNNFVGPNTIFEGSKGFAQSYSFDSDLSILDEPLSFGDSQMQKTSIKPHACCRYKQGPLDMILKVVIDNDLEPNDVEKINVYMVKTGMSIVSWPEAEKRNPKNTVDIQFSMHFGAAVATLYRKTLLEEYSQENINNSDVKSMMNRVFCYHDPDLDKEFPKKWPSRVVIETSKGTFSEYLEYPKGEPENQLSWEELIEKFKYLTGTVYTSNEQDNIIDAVRNLDQIENINVLSKLL
ncbi:MmgE/PrpD family protein [Virgibacillus litoralis]|uniref:2-methylcitrate dehydratase PrpD n=1 Tax=Virgibacillus litoralis TaxID=578221 RepID=A0ABS4H8A3_9BACI|nr:MmgE/PrpD family protein [Virgibacillus litoralis]MBP1947088.1 2-methylcitrate dehydratase PrpD [Virgibacillus litoralis]